MKLDWMKERWGLITQITGYLVSVITGFVVLPTRSEQLSQIIIIEPLSVFVVSIIVLLFLVIAAQCNKRAHLVGWFVVTTFIFCLFLLSIYSYSKTAESGTCRYLGKVIPIGNQYTEIAEQYSKTHPEKGCSELLGDYQGVDTYVWTSESINSIKRSLIMIYLLTVTLGSLCLLSALQLLFVWTKKE